tara:strand:- start:150703 stop:152514 length:1812 start_codon:yes stop_codon:yes gene_type:complete
MADAQVTPQDLPQNASDALSVTGKRWQWRHNKMAHGIGLAQRLQVPEIVGQILASRIETPEEGRIFLEPNLRNLPDPLELKDMDKAVERLVKAVTDKEQITIFGDYDVDGSCGSALLMKYFGWLGCGPHLYIPDRMSEGYGPNPGAMEKIHEAGGKVIVTVDTGSLAFDAFNRAKELGLDVVITDHHQTQSDFPPCVALVNPNRMDETSDLTNLAGAGVAFMLVMAVNRGLREANYFEGKQEPDLRQLLDLVAVASVCDMVPLTGINRILVDRGLKVMGQRSNMGLTALADVSGLDTKPGTYHAGFMVGPRINAGGRIGACDLGANLLLTQVPEEARSMAAHLNALNEERKEIEQQVLTQALDKADEIMKQNPASLVVAGEGWHPGVIGIVAARIKEVHHRPIFVVSFDEDGVGKGSGRSITGIDLGKAVISAKEAGLLESGGGHKMAAGLTVLKDKFNHFVKHLEEHIQAQVDKVGADVFTPCLKVDGTLSPKGATLALLDDVEKLEPYGAGNPEPRFVLPSVRADGMRVVGENHLKFRLTDGAGSIDVIAFRAMATPLGPWLMNLQGRTATFCGKLRRNVWQNRESIQLQLDDAYDGSWGS